MRRQQQIRHTAYNDNTKKEVKLTVSLISHGALFIHFDNINCQQKNYHRCSRDSPTPSIASLKEVVIKHPAFSYFLDCSLRPPSCSASAAVAGAPTGAAESRPPIAGGPPGQTHSAGRARSRGTAAPVSGCGAGSSRRRRFEASLRCQC